MSNAETTAESPGTVAPASGPASGGHGHSQGSLFKLAVGAIGVVFGDIGTSPLYALRDTFAGHHPLPLDLMHIFGIISLMFWSMMIIVTFKYVTVIMRADNKGEGGSLALLALINQHTDGKRWGKGIILLGVFGTTPKADRVIPNKVFQSLACGRPVITRSASAYPEGLAAAEQTGLVWVPPGDAQSLADRVATLAANPARLRQLGEAAATSSREYFSDGILRDQLDAALNGLHT
ncbi:MAG: hypothetical protein B7X78_02525 [Sphingomonadales bacterium 39-62-4]|nr:MAG: hypothetical protein B7X78_02525 [Sphingomonadales bacterium 39-62-4]